MERLNTLPSRVINYLSKFEYGENRDLNTELNRIGYKLSNESINGKFKDLSSYLNCEIEINSLEV